nr:MAG TPA_asm: hypothetical protein [Bacteriophage sp.]DAV69466.1 MAG TPA: hypothetical protein [Bacteriophage sp.]
MSFFFSLSSLIRYAITLPPFVFSVFARLNNLSIAD